MLFHLAKKYKQECKWGQPKNPLNWFHIDNDIIPNDNDVSPKDDKDENDIQSKFGNGIPPKDDNEIDDEEVAVDEHCIVHMLLSQIPFKNV